jgi:hypothetical protein
MCIMIPDIAIGFNVTNLHWKFMIFIVYITITYFSFIAYGFLIK